MKIRDKGKREKGTKGEVVERKRELVLESVKSEGDGEKEVYIEVFGGWGVGVSMYVEGDDLLYL